MDKAEYVIAGALVKREMLERFKVVCAGVGLTSNEAIEAFVRSVADGDIELTGGKAHDTLRN